MIEHDHQAVHLRLGRVEVQRLEPLVELVDRDRAVAIGVEQLEDLLELRLFTNMPHLIGLKSD